jgi:DNA-binding PadR family transcriptional regulator
MAFKGDLEALVLGVLEGTELHGYEISKRIRTLSDRTLSVGEGQLYPALHLLEQNGLVTADWVPQGGRPPRRVYRLTDRGCRELSAKRNDWKAFADGVQAILSVRKTAGASNG